MKAIIDIILVALVTIYIVDLSGFTETLLKVISHYKGRKITELKPFSCSLCMVWWVCIIYSLCTNSFSLATLAYIALLSFLSNPLGQFFIFIREGLCWVINKMIGWYE